MSTSNDGAESVDHFLARIASIREGRDQASEERNRRIEEDFLKNRKERQARRLERARSLSPSKTGPSSINITTSDTPPLQPSSVLNPPVDFSPRSSTLSRSNAVSAKTSPKQEAKVIEEEPPDVVANASVPIGVANTLSRSGTLSWQQRPARGGNASRPRPLSTIETVRPTRGLGSSEHDDSERELSRDQIAATLGTKDPSWFRQTQERGVGSAAFRKSQVEDSPVVGPNQQSQILPGMTGRSSRPVAVTVAASQEQRSVSEDRTSSLQASHSPHQERSPTPALRPDAPKPRATSPQISLPQSTPDAGTSTLTRSGSTLAQRSPSPTKGLGGFVESAMNKRSDSVSRRWNVRANEGLQRSDSQATRRPLSGARPLHASSLSRDAKEGDSLPLSLNKPVLSSQTREQEKQLAGVSEPPQDAMQVEESIDDTARPKSPPEEERLSRSPSKTMDPRRWSPTKASWLESALLSQPEPPKMQPAKDDTPAWKATLQRSKASRDLSPDKALLSSPSIVSTKTKHVERSKPGPVVAKKPGTEAPASMGIENPEVVENDSNPGIAEQSPKNQPILESSQSSITKVDSNQVIDSSQPADVDETTQKHARSTTVDKAPSPVVKAKPQTPPKIDLRSGLKSRTPATTANEGTEPEFRSMFGKLKRAQTQNYVAPDTLKTNILQGKAALNTTGGPQKSQRVDEFKESILQKKEAMKASAGQKKDNPKLETQSSKPEPVVPEALARRKTLHKATPSVTKLQDTFNASTTTKKEQPKPVTAPKPKSIVTEASPLRSDVLKTAPSTPDLKSSGRPLPLPDTRAEKTTITPRMTVRADTASDLTGTSTSKAMDPKRVVDTSETPERPLSTAKSDLLPGSKLASRLNPGLAALLSRGGGSGSRVAENAPPSVEQGGTLTDQSQSKSSATEDSLKAGELTHMTKGRARGPKRRAPKQQASEPESDTHAKENDVKSRTNTSIIRDQIQQPPAVVNSLKDTVASRSVDSGPSPKLQSTMSPKKPVDHDARRQPVPEYIAKHQSKPAVASKSPDLARVASAPSSSFANEGDDKIATSTKFEVVSDAEATLQPTTTKKPERPLTPKPTSTPLPLTPSKSRINTPKPLQGAGAVPAKPQSAKPSLNLGIAAKQPATTQASSGVSKLPPLQSQSPDKLNSRLERQHSNTVKTQQLLENYLGTIPKGTQSYEFDVQKLLAKAVDSSGKSKTISHSIWEITGDGKKSAMPPQQEHILYEESLYLLVHTFETNTGRSSEVYLWCGDGVGDAAIEDAQLFCRKDAREHNAKLEVVRQGKESGHFFQALGGILIVRRNKSSSLYMLCGRRHLGHVTFDEIDLHADNLCPGFCYLISAKFGKLYLWKGKGSGADEVGCARLIGMDLGLTGEIEEVAEGDEPSTFWDAFSGSKPAGGWNDDWQRRVDHNCYPTNLYRVEIDRPKSGGGFWGLRAASPPKSSNKSSIETIAPFTAKDIEASCIYVLDAYRSIYVILASSTANRSGEFVTALHLAQDVAMLSPSMQDRALLPTCHVVLGEPPKDVKACFRKWSLGKLDAPSKTVTCLGLEEVMEALKA